MSNYEELQKEIVENLGEEKEREFRTLCYNLGEHYIIKCLQTNYGKDILEKLFLKQVSELFKIEIDYMNVTILESSVDGVQVNYVMWEDKFQKQYQVNYNNEQFTIREYNNIGMCDWIKTININNQ